MLSWVETPFGRGADTVNTTADTTALATLDDTEVAVVRSLQATTDAARETITYAFAPNTTRAYESDFASWTRWCALHGLDEFALHPDDVVAYLQSLLDEDRGPDRPRGLALSTVRRRASALVAAASRLHPDRPTLRGYAPLVALLAGAKGRYGAEQGRERTRGERRGPARALRLDELRRLVDDCNDGTLAGLRDRALLLVGYAGALRRSELAGLQLDDVVVPDDVDPDDGVVLVLHRTKARPDGRTVDIPRTGDSYCPVAALSAYLERAGLRGARGPLFRATTKHDTLRESGVSGDAVNSILRRRAVSAGVDTERLSAHSLRRGCLTSAARAGAAAFALQDHAGHRSADTTAGYLVRPYRFTVGRAALGVES